MNFQQKVKLSEFLVLAFRWLLQQNLQNENRRDRIPVRINTAESLKIRYHDARHTLHHSMTLIFYLKSQKKYVFVNSENKNTKEISQNIKKVRRGAVLRLLLLRGLNASYAIIPSYGTASEQWLMEQYQKNHR